MNNAKTNASKNLKTAGSFITKNYKMLLAVLFGLFVIYWLMFVLTPKMSMSDEEKSKIDSLNVLIMEMNKNQQILDDRIDDLNEEIDEVDNDIDKIKEQKNATKKAHNDKINRAAKFNEPELDSFFTDRYK